MPRVGLIRSKVVRVGLVREPGSAATAVRVKLRVRRGSITRDVVALVNSGYEADTRSS